MYSERDDLSPWNDRFLNTYHPRNPIGELFNEHNRHVLIEALNHLEIELSGQRILDVGCGYGNWLRSFVDIGAEADKCFGIDLSASRIDVARQKNSLINYQEQSLFSLPFNESDFDIVFQSVVFSSILDTTSRIACATEMKRVLKNNGLLIWLDLIHTKSPELHAFKKSEVHELFTDLKLVYQKKVQPSYFRRVNGRFAPFSRFLSEICDWGCESMIMIFRK